jgi:16S rRNA (cytosine967-C5)-methyltransferase
MAPAAEAIAELQAKQAAILAGAARLVKGGGRLVYATCSLLNEENDFIAEQFLETHPDFTWCR